MNLRLLTNRVYTAAAFQIVFGGAALFGGQIVMPLYFQLQRTQPIVDTGLLFLPFGLGAAATFPLAGRLLIATEAEGSPPSAWPSPPRSPSPWR